VVFADMTHKKLAAQEEPPGLAQPGIIAFLAAGVNNKSIGRRSPSSPGSPPERKVSCEKASLGREF